MELWLVCALLTVVCYGVGEGLSKEPTVRLGSARMLVLYALGNAPIYAAWFLFGSGWAHLPLGAVLLGIYDHPGDLAVGRAWLAPMLLAILMWGAWGIVEKLAINALGFAGNSGIYVIVSTPLYLAIALPRLRDRGSWDRVGIREAIPSLLLFGIAGITIFLAIGLGPIAIVVPLTTAYPVVAILVRRLWMDERMTMPQKVAVVFAIVGAAPVSL